MLNFGDSVGAVRHIHKPVIAVTVGDCLPDDGLRQKIKITGRAAAGISHQRHESRKGIHRNDVLAQPATIAARGVEDPVARPRPKPDQVLVAQVDKVCELIIRRHFGDKASPTSRPSRNIQPAIWHKRQAFEGLDVEVGHQRGGSIFCTDRDEPAPP